MQCFPASIDVEGIYSLHSTRTSFFICLLMFLLPLKVHCTISRMLYSMAARIVILQSFVTATVKVECALWLFFVLFVV